MLLRLFIISTLLTNYAYAQKISLGVGAYSIDAKVGENSTNITNLGAYRIQYHSKIMDQFELIIGYNIFIEEIYKGDKAFGPSVGFSYYPFGSDTVGQASISNISISTLKQLNPYVFANFNQRQYQSVKAAYSGFSMGFGAEAGWNKEVAFFADVQYGFLDGPNEGEATELTGTVGITYNY